MRTSLALAAAVLSVAAAHGVARAHFDLVSPPAAFSGQKAAPCGGGTDNGMVTTVQPGSMISIEIDETIFHPGHYRVALAQNVADLPAAPAVTPGGGDPCAMTTIDPSPQMPVLADGVFAHTAPFGGANQSMQVQLPAGFTCDNCVLQVIQYMRQHSAPCFYYRCATLKISDGPVGGDDAGVNPTPEDPAGGCCDANSSPATSLLGLGLVGALLLRRRRR